MYNKTIIFLFVLAVFLLAGCKERHDQTIDTAYQLSATKPDSALKLLDGVEQSKLTKPEQARFALVYTIAQDKSGLDVDNDSLLRIAYTYYNNMEEDSLYAKCEYYMGKYYMLNDSTELALDCLQKSIEAAEKQHDKYTQCLALEKYSRVVSWTNPQKAVEVARLAEVNYMKLPGASKYNICYYKLNVGNVLLFADSIAQAENKCKEALSIALTLKDSDVISDVYQDLSVIVKQRKDFRMALKYSKASYNSSTGFDITKALNLAAAYLDADSLVSCNRILNSIQTDKAKRKYLVYKLKHFASIKWHNYNDAYIYADSAYQYLEQMYGNQLNSKQKYYDSLVKTTYDKGIAKERAHLLSWLMVITSILALAIIILIMYSYRQYRVSAKARLKLEETRLQQEEKIHNEELRHKEIHFSTVRSYILKKIDVAQVINQLRKNKDKPVVLADEDWKEILMFVDKVDGGFVSRLRSKYPDLKENEIRFMTLIRLNLSSKALGLIYNISEKSIRQKLFVYKSKFGLEKEKGQSLRSFIENF